MLFQVDDDTLLRCEKCGNTFLRKETIAEYEKDTKNNEKLFPRRQYIQYVCIECGEIVKKIE